MPLDWFIQIQTESEALNLTNMHHIWEKFMSHMNRLDIQLVVVAAEVDLWTIMKEA